MTTLITHIYNEEFLLPFWIKHHVENFSDGIVIDFHSSDRSLEIIEEFAPHWKVIKSPIQYFEAETLDRLIESVESTILGVRICLNVTEFLIGDAASVTKQQIIPQVSLINMPNDLQFDPGIPFHSQRKFGLIPNNKTNGNKNRFPIFSGATGRSIHLKSLKYPLGRHFDLMEPNEMLIYRVSDCFVNDEMIKRRLQIQSKIPKSEHKKGRGDHHTNSGRGLVKKDLIDLEKIAQENAINLSGTLDQAIFFQDFHKKIRTATPISISDHQLAWTAVKNNFEIEGVPTFNFNTLFGYREINTLREQYENSVSWRIMKPIRFFGNFIRKFPAKVLLKLSN